MAETHRLYSKTDVISAYKDVFSTQAGQVVLSDLLRLFGFVDRSTFVSDDPYGRIQAGQEGQRSVIIHIGKRIEGQPDDVEDQSTGEM
jgi:hypothetical protein